MKDRDLERLQEIQIIADTLAKYVFDNDFPVSQIVDDKGKSYFNIKDILWRMINKFRNEESEIEFSKAPSNYNGEKISKYPMEEAGMMSQPHRHSWMSAKSRFSGFGKMDSDESYKTCLPTILHAIICPYPTLA